MRYIGIMEVAESTPPAKHDGGNEQQQDRNVAFIRSSSAPRRSSAGAIQQASMSSSGVVLRAVWHTYVAADGTAVCIPCCRLVQLVDPTLSCTVLCRYLVKRAPPVSSRTGEVVTFGVISKESIAAVFS